MTTGEILDGANSEGRRGFRQGLADRAGSFVSRHVMANDDFVWRVEGHGSGWPAGISPADKTLEETEDLIAGVFEEHWESSIQSLGSSQES